jgi:uncharacterized protein
MTDSSPPVIDFQTHAIARLRDRVAALDTDRAAILEQARGHRGAEEQVHDAVLAALDAEGLDHLIHVITADWVDMLGMDCVALALLSGKQAVKLSTSGVHFMQSSDLRLLMPGDQPLKLQNVIEGAGLFGPAAHLVRSQALIRLAGAPPMPHGVLALGTRTDHCFDGMTHTRPLIFLGAVVERCLKRWLIS